MVRRPGFEPGISGVAGRLASGSVMEFYPSNYEFNGGGKGGKIIKPDRADFEAWLSRKIKHSLKDYMSVFDKLPTVINFRDIPRLVKNKWYANILRKIAEYLWEVKAISLEDKERIKALVKSVQPREKGKKKGKAPEVPFSEVVGTIKKISRRDYRLVYLVMAYSGARLDEACHLVNNAGRFEAVYLGEAVRVNMGYNRGYKICEYLWMPEFLYRIILRANLKVTDKNVSTYARKRGLLRPKLVRKAHYQLMEDLGISKEIRDFIQNRYSDLGVSEESYSKIRARADQAYEEVVLPKLNELLGGAQVA